MYQLKAIFLTIGILYMMSIPGIVHAYNMMTADELKLRLETKQPTILLDIQKKNAYKENHFYGSVRTYAYPAKTDTDLQSVVQGVRLYAQSGNDVVIVGPRGGKASQRTVDFLITRSIPEEKIFILQGGIRNWPYREMLLSIKTLPH